MANRRFGEVRRCGCAVCAEHPRCEEAQEHARLNRLLSTLDEKNVRRVVGFLAEERGRGGIAELIVITGLSRNTIVRGQRELRGEDATSPERVRAQGGGRKPLEKKLQS